MPELGELIVLPQPPTKQPEAATTWGGGNQPSYAISGYWTPERIRYALDANDAGSFASITALRSYLTRDARIGGMGGARGQRISAPLGLETHLKPAEGGEGSDKRSPSMRQCQAAKPILQSGAYSALIRAHLEGELADIGIAIGALHWEPSGGGGEWTPTFTAWPIEAMRIDVDGNLCAVFADGTEEKIVPGNGRWIVVSSTLVRPWQEGAIRSIATAIAERALAKRDGNRFSEAAGQNPIDATCPEGATDPQRSSFITAVKGITTGKQAIIHDERYKLARLNSKSDQVDIFLKIAALGAQDAAIGYLGTDGTVEKGSTGTYGAVSVLDGVRYDLVERDCVALISGWTQLAIPWAYYNYGRVDLAPKLCIDVPDLEQSAHEKAEHEETRAARKAFHEELAALRMSGVELTPELVLEVAASHDVEISPALAAAIATGKPVSKPSLEPATIPA